MSKTEKPTRIETPQAIRGTQDIFGADAEAFARVVETFERMRKLYRFRRVEMPVFEKTVFRAAWARRPMWCRRKCILSRIAAANR
jgi:hypothetical protein